MSDSASLSYFKCFKFSFSPFVFFALFGENLAPRPPLSLRPWYCFQKKYRESSVGHLQMTSLRKKKMVCCSISSTARVNHIFDFVNYLFYIPKSNLTFEFIIGRIGRMFVCQPYEKYKQDVVNRLGGWTNFLSDPTMYVSLYNIFDFQVQQMSLLYLCFAWCVLLSNDIAAAKRFCHHFSDNIFKSPIERHRFDGDHTYAQWGLEVRAYMKLLVCVNLTREEGSVAI